METPTPGSALLSQRNNRLRRPAHWFATAVIVALTVLALGPPAHADDKGAATAVLASQLGLIEKQRPLNKCLAASPRKNTPCIRQKSLVLAEWAARDIKQVQAAMDGTERACIRSVALQEIAYVGMWRKGALALYRNERKKARRIFLASLKIADAQQQVQLPCFKEVFIGP